MSAPLLDTLTAEVTRGVCRLMLARGFAPVAELILPTGRRLDVAALGDSGELVAVEVKISVEDFRQDAKWPEYLEFCDRFYFAVPETFPQELLPGDQGLIVADRFGGAVLRESPSVRMATARRKAMMLRFARAAADRPQRMRDPDFV